MQMRAVVRMFILLMSLSPLFLISLSVRNPQVDLFVPGVI